MTKKFILAFTIALFIIPSFTLAQAYDISLHIRGYNDSIAYLGYYYGDRLSLADTAISEDGQLNFSGDRPLDQGVYFAVSGDKKKLFEFLVGTDQEFSLRTPMGGSPGQMIIEGSEENEIFYNYLSANKNSFDEIRALQALLKRPGISDDSLALLNHRIDSINKKNIEYKLQLMKKHPGSLTALLFELMREPEVPDFFLDDGRQDTITGYLYYKNHYWEGIEFSDDRLLRTPVFSRKLDTYMNQVISKHPDSVIYEIDKMIAATYKNSDMRQYLLWHFTNTYETSKVMGYDKIFVHMVDKYFTDESYDWLNAQVQKNIIDRANTLRNVLIGTYAPPLIMADTAGDFVALRQVEADYIIVIFWVSTCGECKSEVNTLKEYYKTSPVDLEIYAVNTDTSLANWKAYINRKELDWIHVNGNISLTGDYHDLYDIYSTPVIYVLDDKKKDHRKTAAGSADPGFYRPAPKDEI